MNEKIFIKENKGVNNIALIIFITIVVAIISSSVTYLLLTNKFENTNVNIYDDTLNGTNIKYEIMKTDSPVVAISQKATPSVVGIKISATTENLFGMVSQSGSEGSGIVYSKDGYIITNYHVVEDAIDNKKANIKVLFTDGTEEAATIIAGDEISDLAVIKVNRNNLVPAEIGKSSDTKVGELAVAIGNPLGVQFAGSVTVGYISALNREITADGKTLYMIQTDAAINEGNSGGALVNSKGQIIGINTAKIGATGVEGLGFAIPIDTAIPIIEELITNKKITRPQIGITGFSITTDDAARYNLVVGVYVNDIVANTPASKVDIKKGDVIVGINGKDITTMEELNAIKNKQKIGDEITLKVYRQEKYLDVKLKLSEMN